MTNIAVLASRSARRRRTFNRSTLYVEGRLVEKVGRIDLHAGDGQGFDALLNKLVRIKSAESG